MKAKRVTFAELAIKGILFFPIFTVIQAIPLFENINRIWLALISVTLIVALAEYRYTIAEFLMVVLTVILHVVALFFTNFPMEHVNMLFYFFLWVLLYMFFCKGKNQAMCILRSSDRFINMILTVWTVMVGMAACIPSNYKGSYFYPFNCSSFRLMPTVLVISALAMYMSVKNEDKRYNLFLILPTYAAFMNSSRTYFAVYFVFLVMYIYMVFKSKKLFYALLVPFALLVLFIMSLSGIADKIASTTYVEGAYLGFWGTITSGRSIFWKYDIEAFFDLPVWQQFVGNGFNFIYEVNARHFARIWGHNDIINIAMNFGYIGIIIYLWIFNKLLKSYHMRSRQIPWLVKCTFLGAVFINSMMNMSYTYMCAMISYALFLCVIEEKYHPKDLKVGIGNRNAL